MNILYLTDSFEYTCGRSRQVFILAKKMREEGHSVLMLIGTAGAKDLLVKTNLEYLYNENFLHSNRSLRGFVKAIIELKRIIQKNKIDVIHTNHFYSANIAFFLSKLINIKIVNTVHGAAITGGKLDWFVGDKLIAVSNATKKYIIENSKKDVASKIETIYYALDKSIREYNSSELRKRLSINPATKIITIIGRIVEHKGHIDLINALENVKTDFHLAIVGDGDYRKKVENHLSTKNINYTFTGNVSSPDEFFLLSDLHIVPSRCCEGLPVSIMEAGYYGTPVIASNIEGASEVIDDKISGMLYEAGNVESLTNLIDEILKNSVNAKEMGTQLQKTISSKFSKEELYSSTINLYKELLDNK